MSGGTAISLQNVTLNFPKGKPRGGLGGLRKGLGRLRSEGDHSYLALDDVSFDVAEGEVLGIVGRNGAGKSTLLRVMAGVYRPDRGVAKVAGRITLLAGLGSGFNVHLTGRENIYLYGSVLGHSQRVMSGLVDSVVDFAELGDFIDEPLRTYSSGMRARLGFSVATAVRTNVLLIDEVFAVGDADFKARSKERIREFIRDAGTVVIVSHSEQLLEKLCTRVALVQDGKIPVHGNPKRVIQVYLRRSRAADREEKADSGALATVS